MARDRSFTIDRQDYAMEEDFRNAVRQALLDCEAIGHREGGAFIVTPLRLEGPESFGVRSFGTLGWMFSHTFMPAAKVAQPEVEDFREPIVAEPDAWQEPMREMQAEIDAAREAEPVEAE